VIDNHLRESLAKQKIKNQSNSELVSFTYDKDDGVTNTYKNFKFEGNLFIHDNNSVEKIVIESVLITGRLAIISRKLSTLVIRNSVVDLELSLVTENEISIYINNFNSERIKIRGHNSAHNTNRFNIESIELSKIRVTSINLEKINNIFFFSDISVNYLRVHHSKYIFIDNNSLINIQTLIFFRIIEIRSNQHLKPKNLILDTCKELIGDLQISPSNCFKIYYCNLSNVVISNSDLSRTKSFDLLSSDYEGIKINELIYPQIIHDRNTHRLFKRIALQNQDVINAKLQGINELIAYKNELCEKKKFWSWIPLFAGYWTNKYGSSLKYAFTSWAIISLFLYFLVSLFYSDPLIESIKSGRFFIFALNPTHTLKSVFPKIESEFYKPSIITIDYLSRILIGFMIFQIISAFRFFFKNN